MLSLTSANNTHGQQLDKHWRSYKGTINVMDLGGFKFLLFKVVKWSIRRILYYVAEVAVAGLICGLYEAILYCKVHSLFYFPCYNVGGIWSDSFDVTRNQLRDIAKHAPNKFTQMTFASVSQSAATVELTRRIRARFVVCARMMRKWNQWIKSLTPTARTDSSLPQCRSSHTDRELTMQSAVAVPPESFVRPEKSIVNSAAPVGVALVNFYHLHSALHHQLPTLPAPLSVCPVALRS